MPKKKETQPINDLSFSGQWWFPTRQKLKYAGIGLGTGLILNGLMVAGIKDVGEYFRQTRQDLDFSKNNLNCTAAYEHKQSQDDRAFMLYWILLVISLFSVSFTVATRSLRYRAANTRVFRAPEVAEITMDEGEAPAQGNNTISETLEPNEIPFRGCNAKTIALSSAAGFGGGFFLNGISAGIRYSYDYGQTRRDFSNDNLGCIQAFKDEQWDIKRDFAIYWALLGVGFFFTFVFFIAEALRSPRAETETAPDEETALIAQNR